MQSGNLIRISVNVEAIVGVNVLRLPIVPANASLETGLGYADKLDYSSDLF